MRIDIIVTRDDGSTITIGSNQQVAAASQDGARLWHMLPNFPALRSMTKDESWAASFLCAQMGMRHLPVDPANLGHLRAALAYNEPTDRERGEDEEFGRINARARYKPGATPKPPEGVFHANNDGDAQLATVNE